MFFYGALEPFCLNVRVYLSRGDVGVSQHQLQAAQIGAMRQHVRREGVAKNVR